MGKVSWYAGLAALIFLVIGCTGTAEKPSRLLVGPFLQQSSGSAVTVIIETDVSCKARLFWGEPGELDRSVVERSPATIHRLEMSGLEPASTYAYAVKIGGAWTDTAAFATPPSGPDAHWRLAIYSDTQSQPEVHAAVVRHIMAEKPAVVLHIGDFTNDGRDHELWAREFFTPAAPLGRSVPFIPVIGNHEYDSPWFYRYFGMDTTGSGHTWYSLDLGGAHFTLLNSDFKYAAWDETSEQARWLIDDLGQHSNAHWKIAAFHHPLFSSRNSRPIAPQRWLWHQLLNAGGIDISFHGHEHNYFRSEVIGTIDSTLHRRGFPDVIVGSGGGETKNIDPQDYGRVEVEQVGFVTVDFSAERLICRALDTSGVAVDSFTIEHGREPQAVEFASFTAELFQRQLTEAIYKCEPLELANGRLEGSVKLSFPAFFNFPLAANLEWDMPPGWRIDSATYDKLIEPRKVTGFEFHVSARPQTFGPSPTAIMKLTQPGGGQAFVNDRIVFHPFKIKRTDPLVAGKLDRKPLLDGTVSADEWQGSALLDKFHVSIREIPAGPLPYRTSVRLGYLGDTLYIGGVFLGSPDPARSIARDRDLEDTLEDEDFAVSFGSADSSYTLILSSASSILDARNGNPAWNMAFEHAVATSDSSWRVELAIPLDQFPAGRPDRINLYRQEYGGLICDEWNPTYRPMTRTYSVIPAYGIRYTDLTAMVALKYD